MELLGNLRIGLETAVSPINLLYCFLGVLLGTLVGVLPGLGAPTTVAMLLPATFALKPAPALIMLAGIYYGAQYGGSTTSILVNVPGEAGAIVTTLDGYRMAQQGRAGPALATAAIGSFIAGCIATLVIVLFAPLLAQFVLKFGPAEYFSLMVLGLIASVVLAAGSLLKAVAMIVLGLLLGCVGVDINTGTNRYTFGIPALVDGIGFIPVSMGMFGIAEIVRSLENEETRTALVGKVANLMPTREDFHMMVAPMLRGTALGCMLGILPGGGAVISSFASYSLEKKLAKDSSRFGKGAIEGVAGPESANNAGAQTAFIPMLTMGIPSSPVMAMMIGAMIIQGIQPGPQVMTSQPSLFWGLIVSMWVGNLMLVILNLPLIGIWVRLLQVPYQLLFPMILVFCSIGVYSLSNATFDAYVMAIFGVLGYVLIRLDCEPAPLILGYILGPMMEVYLRRAMLLSRGDPMVFIEQPISAMLLVLAAFAFACVMIPAVRKAREKAF